MKKFIRTIGIDDAAFNRNKSSHVFVFGVVMRGSDLIEGILRTEITVDGLDATEKIAKMIIESQFTQELKTIFFESATIAAFNVIDMNRIYKITKIPVVIILSKKPDRIQVQKALENVSNGKQRLDILDSNPKIHEISFVNQIGRKYRTHVQFVGIEDVQRVKQILRRTSYTSSIPESLRIADMIGQSFKNYCV